MAAFAAFREGEIAFFPNEGKEVCISRGVVRTFCTDCGSSLTGRYDYLPDQVFISMGVIDQANNLAPELHAHEAQRITWLHIDDHIERSNATASDALKDSRHK